MSIVYIDNEEMLDDLVLEEKARIMIRRQFDQWETYSHWVDPLEPGEEPEPCKGRFVIDMDGNISIVPD